MSHNSIFQSSYTWSKNIANVEGDYPNNQDGIADLYNPRASRGLSNFDRPQVFSSSLVYNLPALEGRNAIRERCRRRMGDQHGGERPRPAMHLLLRVDWLALQTASPASV